MSYLYIKQEHLDFYLTKLTNIRLELQQYRKYTGLVKEILQKWSHYILQLWQETTYAGIWFCCEEDL